MPSITLTFSSEHALRIQTALESDGTIVDADENPRSATVADLKKRIIGDVARFVRATEQRTAEQAAANNVGWVDIT